jgi:hypothetical protein
MAHHNSGGLETDDRFTSGEWRGYYFYPGSSQRHWMRLWLTFQPPDVLQGEGHDYVGAFTFLGCFERQTGACRWTKHYVGKHDVQYAGQAGPLGIHGVWTIESFWSGAFRLWPDHLGDLEFDDAAAVAQV